MEKVAVGQVFVAVQVCRLPISASFHTYSVMIQLNSRNEGEDMEEWWRGKCNNFQIMYFLFIYSLFNDAVSSSEYTVSNGKMVSKCCIVKEVESRLVWRD